MMPEPVIPKSPDLGSPSRHGARGTRTPAPAEPKTLPRLTQLHDHATFASDRELPRRVLNVLAASVLILLTSPLMLVVAILVKLTSRGPVIYTQTRVGLDRRGGRSPRHDSRRRDDIGGAPFTIYKFRTMRVDAESAGAVWAKSDDDRCTPIGKVLRQFRLDELPQLFNVLRGDMNLVGPRPERPTIFAELRKQIPEYQKRQLARPGITGWAQVNQSYDQDLDDVKRKVQFDIDYIRRQSLVGGPEDHGEDGAGDPVPAGGLVGERWSVAEMSSRGRDSGPFVIARPRSGRGNPGAKSGALSTVERAPLRCTGIASSLAALAPRNAPGRHAAPVTPAAASAPTSPPRCAGRTSATR